MDFYIQILAFSLGVSFLEVGVFTAAVFATQVFSHPLAGYLADRFSRKTTLAFGGLIRVLSLAQVGLGFAFASPVLITSGRAFQGMAAGFFWTSSSAIIADETELGGRGEEFGTLNLWVYRGMIVGALGGLLLLPLRLDLPPYYFALAAAISAVYALRIQRPSSPMALPKTTDLPLQNPPATRSVTAGLATINFLNSVGVFAFYSFLTFHVALTVLQSLDNTTKAFYIALANSPQVGVAALAASKLGRMTDRIGRVQPLTLSLVLLIPLTYLLRFITELWHLAVLGLMVSIAFVVFGSAYNSVIGDMYTRRRGFAYGGLNMAFALGAAAGSIMGGLLYADGWVTVLYGSIIVQAVSLVGLLPLWRGYRLRILSKESWTPVLRIVR